MYCDIPDFGRCCICLPLRRGILLFGYINILVSVLLVAVYSYSIHQEVWLDLVYHGAAVPALQGLSLALYLLDALANAVLVYGAHVKNVLFIKCFYYYAITTTVASVVISFSSIFYERHVMFEMIVLLFAGLCVQLYLIALVRSLIRTLTISGPGPNCYENQLQQVIAGEVYEPTVVPVVSNQAA